MFRSAAVAGRFADAFDANDGKDHDGSGRFARSAPEVRVPVSRGRVCRKCDDRPHLQFFLAAALK